MSITSFIFQASHWLRMLTVGLGDAGATSSTTNGQPAAVQVRVSRSCSLNDCLGCTTLSLQVRSIPATQRARMRQC